MIKCFIPFYHSLSFFEPDLLSELTDNEYDWSILEKLLSKAGFEFYPEDTYEQLYSTLKYTFNDNEKMVISFLKKYGFDGVIFDSFEKGKDVKNIVVFDDNDIQIKDKQIIKTR